MEFCKPETLQKLSMESGNKTSAWYLPVSSKKISAAGLWPDITASHKFQMKTGLKRQGLKAPGEESNRKTYP